MNANHLLFEKLWNEQSRIPLQKEYRFCEGRKFRADFALTHQGILIEIEGGTFSGGRHVRPLGYQNDCEKYNIATRLGWRVIRLTSKMITKEWIAFIKDMIDEEEQNKN